MTMETPFSRIKNSAVEALIRTWANRAANRFERRDPLSVQRTILRHLIGTGRSTRFGKDYGFSELGRLPFDKLYQNYRQRIPIRTYADFWRSNVPQAGCSEGIDAA